MGFCFNSFLLSELCLSVLCVGCTYRVQLCWALSCGKGDNWLFLCCCYCCFVSSSIPPWCSWGLVSFQKRVEPSWEFCRLVLSSQQALLQWGCWISLQISLPSPAQKARKGLGRDEVPADPTVLGQPGASFTLGQAHLLQYGGTKGQASSRVRKSFPCLEVSELISLKVEQEKVQCSVDAHQGSVACKCSWNLLCSCSREWQHAWKSFTWLCWDPLGACRRLYQQNRGGCPRLREFCC